MTRIEKLLNSKGRQIIGWDEILEGDVDTFFYQYSIRVIIFIKY